MRVVIAPDKFKGSLTAREACAAIAAGIRRVDPQAELDLCPMADGGEGIVDALVEATGGEFVTRGVTGPIVDMKVEARIGVLGTSPTKEKTAVVEMASASGLALLRNEDRDPFHTTTYGTGQLLLEAAKLGAGRIILGIGGSATVDGGIGCAQACGLPVIMEDGAYADGREPLVGADLERVVLVKHGRGSPIERVKIVVACDVDNPLVGPNGAARVFGPQKGATAEQVEKLNEWLKRLAERCGKMEEAGMPGAGAAGGLGFAMLAFFGAELKRGFEVVAEAVKLRERLDRSDLCFTGEGKLDASSLNGKAPIGVGRLCKERNVPCIALAGSVEAEQSALQAQGISMAKAISTGSIGLEESMRRGRELVADAAENAFRLWLKSRGG